ncbi:MAG: hypothetical protein N2512_03160, partial [Armatimonadetes bacterium]|nr:hypothetical protein [Armatimonadota bacterium]
RWGLRPPQRVALRASAKIWQAQAPVEFEGRNMAASWLLCWSGEAEGPPDFEVPWLVVLQRRPQKVSLGEEGLVLDWPAAGGWVALMPLYGYLKLPRRPPGYLAEHGLPPIGPQPWRWEHGLPRDVAQRCDWWARVVREYPLTVDESFSVNPRNDTITFRYRYTWLSTDDDWRTPHLKFGVLSPVLGLAYLGGTFPMTVKPAPVDAGIFTPFGPTVGAVGTDEVTVSMPVLKYVHEMTVLPAPEELSSQRAVSAAEKRSLGLAQFPAQRVAEIMRAKFRTGRMDDIWDHGGADNYCWQVMGDRYYCRALPFCDPETRRLATQTLREYFANFVLTEDKYTEFRGKLLLKGPGIGTWGGYDDAGKFSSNLLETIWEYAQSTGDWELIRQRWPLILRFFVTPRECDFRTFGRAAIAELGDEAAPPLCLARMAWRVGDLDTYAYACNIFARELVHHYVKRRRECAEYFRQRQPWHSFEFMPEEVYLTNLWGDTAGWQIDGPTYPAQTGERQYNNRWVRFSNEDVARFHRDVLSAEMRAEMDLLLSRPDCPYRPGRAEAHIAPSMEQLRSMLLWEPPDKLAQLTPPETAQIGRAADAISFYLAFVRTARPPRFQRLVPSTAKATSFAVGLPREQPAPFGSTVVAVSTDTGAAESPGWPTLAWWGWAPPKRAEGLPYADRLSFGQIVASSQPPREANTHGVSWTTRVFLVK